jgi:AraC-like DNA-binding protein
MEENTQDNDSVEILTLEQQGFVEQPTDPSKTGPKAKKLVAVEVMGYQVGRGLKRRIVNPDEVYKVAAIGSTDREIARWFGMNEDTLRYNFADILATAREDLKQSLRMAQVKLALSGNATMLIWLGKQILGQQENPSDSEANTPLPWDSKDL